MVQVLQIGVYISVLIWCFGRAGCHYKQGVSRIAPYFNPNNGSVRGAPRKVLGTGVSDWNDTTSQCTLAMFGGDEAAYWACRTEYAFQQNWWPSPIAGLFSYQTWNGFDGFWRNGAVLEVLTNFMAFANNSRYISVVHSSYRNLSQLLRAYGPQPSYDDMAWYGLSFARIAELLGDSTFLSSAQQIYDWNWKNGWDTNTSNCHGGMWFDQDVNAKQTITNVQMLQLGARLYHLTSSRSRRQELMSRVNLTMDFLAKNFVINPLTFQIADGININNCTPNHVYGITCNSGVFLGGLAELYKATNQTSLLNVAQMVANATMTLSSKHGVLMEYCDLGNQTCDNDAKMFKGIFVRNLRYLADVSDQAHAKLYRGYLATNMRSLLSKSICEPTVKKPCNISYRDGRPFHNSTGPVFGTRWFGPFSFSSPMQDTSALELLVANIAQGTRCHGDGCAYDPPTPPPRPFTCQDHPCPADEACCAYSDYYTCCTPDQKCVNGICE
ncbi:uncharacterized protein LOC106154774 [Lingula anatina]|uniref:Uncharacterized protein LOC106154774 n=1 Tax=Lingula anatina TaxID=7574 RepID=A0A1S3HF57_LINAN|nr:uncharacterized protein LOC106154774 [Lingula anatina]|eukprot:XP_013384707.1 uncharacterized protein LOC106154774 [Lingula anatina]